MKYIFLIYFLLILNTSYSQYSINSIPDPKKQGQDYFVSDPQNILGEFYVDSLNRLCQNIEKESSAEVAIVVVDDFEGSSDFDFAYNLFNHWGIGKSENNNGLLVFVAKDRRKYQFITGLGMEGRLPDVVLGNFGEKYLVPKFRNEAYGEGIVDAMNAIKSLLLHPENIETLKAEPKRNSFFYKNQNILLAVVGIFLLFLLCFLWLQKIGKSLKLEKQSGISSLATGCGCLAVLIFFGAISAAFFNVDVERMINGKSHIIMPVIFGSLILLFEHQKGINRINESFKDEENAVNALKAYNNKTILLMLLSPLSFFSLIGYYRRKAKLKERLQPPDNSGSWLRLNRDSIKTIATYLNTGQLKEEKLKSLSYEIWQHGEPSNIKLIGWQGKNFNKYENCPKCSFHTLNKTYTKTIKSATYSSTGIGEKIQDCENCDFKQSFGTVILPKLVESSSSSGSSSSGSSSSSSSGSWGGGRSGGGGAGGSW